MVADVPPYIETQQPAQLIIVHIHHPHNRCAHPYIGSTTGPSTVFIRDDFVSHVEGADRASAPDCCLVLAKNEVWGSRGVIGMRWPLRQEFPRECSVGCVLVEMLLFSQLTVWYS